MRKGIVGAGNLIVDKIKVIDRWPGEGNLCNIRSTVSSAGGGPCNVLFDIAAAGQAAQQPLGITVMNEGKLMFFEDLAVNQTKPLPMWGLYLGSII